MKRFHRCRLSPDDTCDAGDTIVRSADTLNHSAISGVKGLLQVPRPHQMVGGVPDPGIQDRLVALSGGGALKVAPRNESHLMFSWRALRFFELPRLG